MQTPKSTFDRRSLWPILILVGLGAALILWDSRQVLFALRHADWTTLPGALLFTALSYFCVSYNYALLSRMQGIRMSVRDLAEICFATTVLNHVVRSGGVAGFTLRYLMMRRSQVSLEDVLSSSLLHYYLTSLDMLLMLPIGLAYLLLNAAVPAPIGLLLKIMTGFLLVLTVLFTLLVLSRGARAPVIARLRRLFGRFKRPALSDRLVVFDERLARAVAALSAHPGLAAYVILITMIDWLATVVVLWFCLDAFGESLSLTEAASVFVVSTVAGALSALPGGIVVQEASMTGMAMFFGATFAQGALASLLFRIVYYFIPYFVSLPVYWRHLRQPAGVPAG
jgi:uncharacterized protein (TIRG00374 family)